MGPESRGASMEWMQNRTKTVEEKRDLEKGELEKSDALIKKAFEALPSREKNTADVLSLLKESLMDCSEDDLNMLARYVVDGIMEAQEQKIVSEIRNTLHPKAVESLEKDILERANTKGFSDWREGNDMVFNPSDHEINAETGRSSADEQRAYLKQRREKLLRQSVSVLRNAGILPKLSHEIN